MKCYSKSHNFSFIRIQKKVPARDARNPVKEVQLRQSLGDLWLFRPPEMWTPDLYGEPSPDPKIGSRWGSWSAQQIILWYPDLSCRKSLIRTRIRSDKIFEKKMLYLNDDVLRSGKKIADPDPQHCPWDN